MATITLGGSNGIVWNGNTKTKAQFAAASSNVTTASSNITLDSCSFNNKVAASPKFVDINGENGFQGNVTVSSNTEELVIDSNTEGAGLFGVGTVTINSGVYLYSDNVSNAALKIAINDVTVSNSGNILWVTAAQKVQQMTDKACKRDRAKWWPCYRDSVWRYWRDGY